MPTTRLQHDESTFDVFDNAELEAKFVAFTTTEASRRTFSTSIFVFLAGWVARPAAGLAILRVEEDLLDLNFVALQHRGRLGGDDCQAGCQAGRVARPDGLGCADLESSNYFSWECIWRGAIATKSTSFSGRSPG